MKKRILLLILFTSFSYAKSNYHNNSSRHDTQVVHICALSPFSEFYAEAAFSEQNARQKTSRRCELGQGKGSIFCKAKDAKCSTSKISFNGDYLEESMFVYTKTWQKGEYLEIDENIPNLSRYDFADKIASYSIPDGWTVRFYEGVNYTGKYHTESGGEHNALGYGEKIRSIKIIRR
ncbi:MULTISPECIES: beta/gamma crystallin-related protein [Providencia]|uniref:beta/gamma crystallin-related protein n=1 Tax=Providencia TaxID=586 RepID=UPI00197E46AC|nr:MULTISPECIES: beta/gamma crystallin-related protein [Providencia]HEC8327189.1 hypothetical protein [Providencia rettgeri]MBN4866754.1 hypothetical protein [Providencia stuartii]MBN4875974.1 hypothetical protein [Providencia stuartii]MBN4880768.1 hypothetical protein [Providencia stuartii]MBN4885174.1 hypothetical protein [Providencia stuartii]